MSEHRARKRFGQNFLHDESIIERIIHAVNPQAGERLVEIGPGLGALTGHLLEACGRLDVVELDRDLIPKLQVKFADKGELTIHEADALKFDFRTLVDSSEQLRVIGNLPYNISTPLLFHLLETADIIRDMHVMLQKEVVDRMTASPGGGDFGRLSVMLQYRCKVERLFSVAPGAFNPAPKVDSAIARLTPYTTFPFVAKSEQALAQIVAQAFSQRRKMLRASLKNMLSAEQIDACNIDPTRRPETLCIEEFVRLADEFST
jgi:16S rRNA (adenine1518-N6/adenine1519-N6)-dimethyltransferase